MSFWACLLLYAVYLLCGAWWIRSAIEHAKERKFVWFSFDLMAGTYVIILLARLALGM